MVPDLCQRRVLPVDFPRSRSERGVLLHLDVVFAEEEEEEFLNRLKIEMIHTCQLVPLVRVHTCMMKIHVRVHVPTR